MFVSLQAAVIGSQGHVGVKVCVEVKGCSGFSVNGSKCVNACV